jgi:hypothetical protein
MSAAVKGLPGWDCWDAGSQLTPDRNADTGRRPATAGKVAKEERRGVDVRIGSRSLLPAQATVKSGTMRSSSVVSMPIGVRRSAFGVRVFESSPTVVIRPKGVVRSFLEACEREREGTC